MTQGAILEPRRVPLGGLRAIDVWRTLPHRDLPTIGAWCFVDHFGPTDDGMQVLPHPHTGLQTVTWPIAGNVQHRDSLGNEVILRPGELNLMTAGQGISHSEFSVGGGDMHGIQLWVALPDGARVGPGSFEHIDDLPRASGDGWDGIVLVGEFASQRSAAEVHSPLVGAEVRVQGGRAVLPLDPTFEHGLLAVTGAVRIIPHSRGSREVPPGELVAHRHLKYLPTGETSVVVETDDPVTLVVIGGEPFTEPLVMWWNFVGRTHDDIVAAREDWEAQTERFGHVDGHDGRVIPAPPMPALRLKPRTRQR